MITEPFGHLLTLFEQGDDLWFESVHVSIQSPTMIEHKSQIIVNLQKIKDGQNYTYAFLCLQAEGMLNT